MHENFDSLTRLSRKVAWTITASEFGERFGHDPTLHFSARLSTAPNVSAPPPALRGASCCNLLMQQHRRRLFLSHTVEELPDVGVVTADGIVEANMPPFTVVVGAQVLIVRIPRPRLHIDQPLLTEILQQRLQDVHGRRLKCA